MSNASDRRKWEKIYGHYYRRFGYRTGDRGEILADQACAYCGTLANDQDHIPPLRWAYALGSAFFDKHLIRFLLVPACRECNATLSDRRLFTLKERCAYLIDRYSRKHARFLRSETVWNEEEIDELGPTIKPQIQGFAIFQLAIDRRIKILEENVRSTGM